MDIESYLQRIEYVGPINPTLETLNQIHRAHLQRVPFENLDVMRGVPIILDRERLYDKIVRNRRGGFCYELNGLFSWLLEELGFSVTLLSSSDARKDGGFGPEYDHLTLRVDLEDGASVSPVPWLVDVGWGDTFCQPLRLEPDLLQPEGLRAYRLERRDGYHVVCQFTYSGTWKPQYRFTLEPRRYEEFRDMCRYHQTSPDSQFTRRRLVTMATPGGRITLDDNRFIVVEHGERQERTAEEDEFQSILIDRFGIELEQ